MAEDPSSLDRYHAAQSALSAANDAMPRYDPAVDPERALASEYLYGRRLMLDIGIPPVADRLDALNPEVLDTLVRRGFTLALSPAERFALDALGMEVKRRNAERAEGSPPSA